MLIKANLMTSYIWKGTKKSQIYVEQYFLKLLKRERILARKIYLTKD